MKDESLGHKIKKLRKKKSLSQERLVLIKRIYLNSIYQELKRI